MISLILYIALLMLGFYFFIKPNNFFLKYVKFYYNPKKNSKPIKYKGGLGAKHLKEFGQTKGILLYMRILGIILFLIGAFFILNYFR